MLEIGPPTKQQERWFGLLVVAVFGVIGGVVFRQLDSLGAAGTLWGVGLAIALLYSLVRPLRRPLYYLWLRLVQPLGWVASQLALGSIYYLILTPIALLMRVFGRDALAIRPGRSPGSFWLERQRDDAPDRYLRQS